MATRRFTARNARGDLISNSLSLEGASGYLNKYKDVNIFEEVPVEIKEIPTTVIKKVIV